MSEKTQAIITTRLPPATCGIGTYSWLLRKHWPGREPFEFLVMDGAEAAAGGAEGDRVTAFKGSGAELARQLERIGPADVLLHYAARAYQRRGCPIWLPGVLARRKRNFPGSRLMIFVHEMPGAHPVTSRHYWLGRVNAWIVRRLSVIADVLVTNTEHHAAALRRITRREDVHLFPIGSNIEVIASSSTPRASAEFVLFGLSFGRLLTLQKFAQQAPRWHEAGRITKLHIIGPDGDDFTQQADELMAHWPKTLAVVRHGILPATEVSMHLSQARFALTNVTRETWSKSGAFMACAAHQCAVVIAEAGTLAAPLSHAIRADELERISDTEVERRTSALADWYRTEADWVANTKRMAELFEPREAA